MRFLKSVLPLVALLILAAGVYSYRLPDTWMDGRAYFVDADCYSRMLRAQEIWKDGLHSIVDQKMENWPEGIRTHATMPMDVCIVALAKLLSIFSDQPLDLAGLWISPLLGLIMLAGLWVGMEKYRIPFRGMALLLLAVSPVMAHAFGVGRPDHQSLEVLLVAFGLFLEFRIWHRCLGMYREADNRVLLNVGWAFSWIGALWVSRYEPLVLLVCVVLLRGAVCRREGFRKSAGVGFLIWMVGVLMTWMIDGARLDPLPPETLAYFPIWSKQIGELRSMPWFSSTALGWIGWGLVGIPILLLWKGWRRHDLLSLGMWGLLVICYGLTVWQRRWEYFFVLVAALVLPHACKGISRRFLVWALFVLSLWPVAAYWEALIYPEGEQKAARWERREEAVLLRQTAEALISGEVTPVLAPWWLCPPIAYWSGQPTVAGSSHQSLPGIVDTARFYASSNHKESLDLLQKRQVVYIVGYEPDRILETALPLVGGGNKSDNNARRLFGRADDIPSWAEWVFTNPYFRVYMVRTGF